MKILLTVHQFFPKHTSGTEVLTLETARELVRRGHDVLIVTSDYSSTPVKDEDRFDQYEFDGLRIERFTFSLSPFAGNYNFTELEFFNGVFARQFGKVLDSFQPDVVHFFHLMRLSISFVDECVKRNIRTVMTPTDFWSICNYAQLMLPDHSPCTGPDKPAVNCVRHFIDLNGGGHRVIQLAQRVPNWLLRIGLSIVMRMPGILRLLPQGWALLGERARSVCRRPAIMAERLNQIDRLLVPTHLMAQMLQKNGVDAQHMTHVPFGINLSYIPDIPRKPSDRLRIGFIGTLARHKGIHVLLEAIRQLPATATLEVKLYGPLDIFPDYVAELRSLANDDARIQFLGTFPNAMIGEIFSGLDVLVVPSIWYENTPLVIYSAHAGNCPVIASDYAGMSEVVKHGVNGLTFPPGDAGALAALFSRLLSEHDLLNHLRSNICRPPSIADYVDTIEDTYATIREARK